MTRLLLAYFAERVRPGVFVPVLAALWCSAVWASGTALFHAGHTLPFLLLMLLVVQFRLWDDIEDVERDRRLHPNRVLVRSPLMPFRRLLAIVAVAALAAAAALDSGVLAGVVALDVAFLIAYHAVRRFVPDRIWRFPVLLAKYPAFVLVTTLAIGQAPGRRAAAAMLVVMTGACVYEAFHHDLQPTGVPS
jgi:hypothetical protein